MDSSRIYYTAFKTCWGWFGLCGYENALLRTCLPVGTREVAKRRLLADLAQARPNKDYFSDVQEMVTAYFEGSYVDFGAVAVCLQGLTKFQRTVLNALRDITYRQTISYKELAKLAGSPSAFRAVGGVLAKNPLPLIIPCHRVIKQDGSLGCFSAAGGVETKKRMLDLEKSLKFP